MDFKVRKTGRGSDGLVRGREYWCQTNETNGKGEGKGDGKKIMKAKEGSEVTDNMEAKEHHRA